MPLRGSMNDAPWKRGALPTFYLLFTFMSNVFIIFFRPSFKSEGKNSKWNLSLTNSPFNLMSYRINRTISPSVLKVYNERRKKV